MRKITKRRRILNSDESIIVISRYRTDTILESQKALKKLAKKQQILVFAQRAGRKRRHSEPDNLTIYRLWTWNSPLSLFSIIKPLIKYNKVRNILIQFDFRTFGRNFNSNLIVPLVLFLLKMTNKRIYFEFHSFVPTQRIRKNTPLKKKIQRRIFNITLQILYTYINSMSTNIIVFKPSLRTSLAAFVPESRIIQLPSTLVQIRRSKATPASRKKLQRTVDDYSAIITTPYDISQRYSLGIK